MEATSARYAARDRLNEMSGPALSQLQRFIQSACSPENYEPNLAVNLEISDLINSKKGTAPREAANAIVGYINHRNPNVALLALSLLDICVKNCGYPFHLQISTKEFLNELVRRFPERPPMRPTRVQQKILGAIEEWRGTICETSRYKEDLGFIRDMHRLLSYKGYTFPEVRREDAAVLNPSDNLKSAEEMEEEEREAQSAKLQELIRRGTPEDLQEANRLMKIMAGYDTRSKVDYRAKAAEEVAKIQKKAILLEERLATFQPGDTMTDGDVFDELASALSSAQPKIQKMCEEESDDHTAVARLLEINDSIHRTVERYKLLKKGDMDSANKIAKGGLVRSGGDNHRNTANGKLTSGVQELSLIDFDTDASLDTQSQQQRHSQSANSPPKSTGIENDLLGLSFNSSSSSLPTTGSIALGFGANDNVPGPALLSSVTQSNTARGQTATPMSSYQPNYSSPLVPAAAPVIADPFASLGLASILTSGTSSPAFDTAQATSTTLSHDDDEWSFSSALPPETLGKPHEYRVVVGNDDVKIETVAQRTTDAPLAISFAFAFSNNTEKPLVELHFQAAVTRGYELQMQPQSGRELAPMQNRGVTQTMAVWHAKDQSKKVTSIKLRWRVSYKIEDLDFKADGEMPEFELA